MIFLSCLLANKKRKVFYCHLIAPTNEHVNVHRWSLLNLTNIVQLLTGCDFCDRVQLTVWAKWCKEDDVKFCIICFLRRRVGHITATYGIISIRSQSLAWNAYQVIFKRHTRVIINLIFQHDGKGKRTISVGNGGRARGSEYRWRSDGYAGSTSRKHADFEFTRSFLQPPEQTVAHVAVRLKADCWVSCCTISSVRQFHGFVARLSALFLTTWDVALRVTQWRMNI